MPLAACWWKKGSVYEDNEVGNWGSQANAVVQLHMAAQGWFCALFAMLLTFKSGLFFLNTLHFCFYISEKPIAQEQYDYVGS